MNAGKHTLAIQCATQKKRKEEQCVQRNCVHDFRICVTERIRGFSLFSIFCTAKNGRVIRYVFKSKMNHAQRHFMR